MVSSSSPSSNAEKNGHGSADDGAVSVSSTGNASPETGNGSPDGAGRSPASEQRLADGDGEREELNATEVIDILSNERRRLLWHYLSEESPEASLGDASQQIAAWENGTTVGEVEYGERKSVYTSLHQFHCPKMDEAGLVEFDKRDSVVRRVSEQPDEFVVEVETNGEGALVTSLVALALSAGIIVGAWALDLPVFGDLTLPAALLAMGIGAAPAVFVYGHLTRTNRDITLPDALSRLDNFDT
ncbi:DUF7344 domain-containing protein [Halorubrum lipolyticum]|uniref:DUF7344 domain-containing protein n=1 Tax=Halorubrum lipolyticum DSM 21995 TaxID=1227482 RepID=M0NVG6_9EURY|nr:hypothetical protein [Halorubrum lipolyticum]EMA61952.1 hypothetical protein C469_05847 [Halorubrum lipolyticum DSM 21995]